MALLSIVLYLLTDIEECLQAPIVPCNLANQSCVNTLGAFQCICDKGFTPAPNITNGCIGTSFIFLFKCSKITDEGIWTSVFFVFKCINITD